MRWFGRPARSTFQSLLDRISQLQLLQSSFASSASTPFSSSGCAQSVAHRHANRGSTVSHLPIPRPLLHDNKRPRDLTYSSPSRVLPSTPPNPIPIYTPHPCFPPPFHRLSRRWTSGRRVFGWPMIPVLVIYPRFLRFLPRPRSFETPEFELAVLVFWSGSDSYVRFFFFSPVLRSGYSLIQSISVYFS